MLIIAYLIIATVVVLLSIRLSEYVDLIDKKTNLSGAFIGGVMLAAVTSLPELFTSLSATVLLDNVDLVMGNILGSNIFNISVMALIIGLAPAKFRKSKLSPSHKSTIMGILAIYAIIYIATSVVGDIKLFNISIFSISIVVIYFIIVKKMSNDENTADPNSDTSPLTLKQIGVRFAVASVLLVLSSIAVTYVSDMMASRYNIGATLAGALLLGIATSLPEVASSISLARMGNYNAMVGNMIGSNLFNFTILSMTDILYTKASIYVETKQTALLIVFGLINTIAMGLMIAYKFRDQQTHLRVGIKRHYVTPCLITVVGYFSFIIFGA